MKEKIHRIQCTVCYINIYIQTTEQPKWLSHIHSFFPSTKECKQTSEGSAQRKGIKHEQHSDVTNHAGNLSMLMNLLQHTAAVPCVTSLVTMLIVKSREKKLRLHGKTEQGKVKTQDTWFLIGLALFCLISFSLSSRPVPSSQDEVDPSTFLLDIRGFSF
jgi:hypothetical protein